MPEPKAEPSGPDHPSAGPDERILVLAPTGRDGVLACAIIAEAGLSAATCVDVADLCAQVEAGAGAALLTEEALTPAAACRLIDTLQHQPPWSDFPLIIVPREGETTQARLATLRLLEPLRNVTFLERPVRVMTLVSSLRAALAGRRRQYEVRDLLQRLEQAVHDRDEFLAMLGHELRNPLGAIANGLQVLGQAPAQEGQVLDLLRHLSGHLTHLVDDLLEVARVKAGKIVLQRRPLDLTETARRCLATLELARPGVSQRVALTLADEPVLVVGDAVRLEQILSNLLTNALKYTPADGKIEVSVQREKDAAVLRVRDEGMGIPADALAHIFEPFTQVVDSLARTCGGLGLGLPLVRRLAELHGGSVAAHSAGPGKGSEFVVRLPSLQASADSRVRSRDRDAVSSSPHSSLLTPHPAPATGDQRTHRRVLLIEDNVANRETLRCLLGLWGHQVEVAEDGLTGLDRLLAWRPDAAVVDIGLPGLDGYQVARRVRASSLGQDILLIALTGYGQPEDRRRALEAGFDVHLVKPADPQLLSRLLSGEVSPQFLRQRSWVSGTPSSAE